MEFSFVLVETGRSENAGAAARALKTMGFADLRLVQPAFSNWEKARAVAHGSVDVLSGALTFASLPEAIADCDFVVATTARRRGSRKEYYSSRGVSDFLRRRASSISRCAVLFGSEESGLSNAHLEHAQLVTSIDLRASHPSLNLAQAVMIYAYELSPLVLEIRRRTADGQNDRSLRALHEKARAYLETLGLARESLGTRILERLPFLGGEDARLVHSLLNRLARRQTGATPPPTTAPGEDTPRR